MTITEMQDEILEAGWQFQEHVFNDGTWNNCFVQICKHKNPHVFGTYPADDETREQKKDVLGWGRFVRHHAWSQALKCVRILELRGLKDAANSVEQAKA